MSTHHDADAQKLKHCLGRLLAAGEVDGTTDPSAAVQTLIRAHPEYGRRPVGEPCDVTSLSLSMKDAARARRVGDARCLPPSPGQGLRPLVLAP